MYREPISLRPWFNIIAIGLILAITASVIAFAPASAGNNGMGKTWDRTADWRANGWTCYRVNYSGESYTFAPEPRYDRYRIVLKGGRKMSTQSDTFRLVIWDAREGQTYAGNQDISHLVWCGKSPSPPPPPPDPVLDPKLWVRVCGDPRMILTVNNRRSTVPVTVDYWFKRASDRTRQHRTVVVPAGERDVFFPHWVVGRSWLRVEYSAPGFLTAAVIHNQRLPRATPWGQGSCPSNLRAAKRLARNY